MSDNSFNPAAEAVPTSEDTSAPEAADTDATTEAELPKTFSQEEMTRIAAAERAKGERKARREMQQEAQRQPVAPPDPRQYTDQRAYDNDLIEYKVAETVAQRENEKHRESVVSSFESREDDARTKYPDYEKVARNDDLNVTQYMADVITASDIGPDVLYHLGQNPGEARRIAGLAPLLQAKEIGRIESSLAGAPAHVKKSSSAPAPINPIASRSASPTYDVTDPRSVAMGTSKWIEARNRQLRSQG